MDLKDQLQKLFPDHQPLKDGNIQTSRIPNLYNQIKQDAILLKNEKKNHKAKLFFNFLKSKDAKKIIQSFGYRITN